MKARFTILCAVTFFLYSCEELYDDFNVKEYKSDIVIEALVTDANPPYYVKVMKTVKFGDSTHIEYLSDAIVTLSDNEGKTETLTAENTGIYRSDNITGKPGNTYKLEVRVGDLNYTSQCKMMPMLVIDTVVPFFRKKTGSYKEGYYIRVNGWKPQADSMNYYKFNLYQNNYLITNRLFTNLVSDESTSFKQQFDIEEVFSLNDTVDLEVFSLTLQTFEYFLDINQLVSTDSYVFGYHRNPASNINNGALGYFQASAYRKIRVIMK